MPPAREPPENRGSGLSQPRFTTRDTAIVPSSHGFNPRQKAEEGQALWLVTRGFCGATLCACLLVSLLLTALPIPFFAAWLLSPPSLDRSYPLVFDYRESQPSAISPLAAPKASIFPRLVPSFLRRNRTRSERALMPGQRFGVTLRLTLPESEHNMELGVFRVSAVALSHSGEVLAYSSVPCMIHYRSFMRRVIRATVFAVPMFLGLIKEAQEIHLALLEGTQGAIPVYSIKTILHPAAGTTARVGLPQISSAKLRVRSHLWGSSPWLALWPLTSFTWLMALLCLYEAIGAFLCCNFFLLPGFGAARRSLTAAWAFVFEPEPESALSQLPGWAAQSSPSPLSPPVALPIARATGPVGALAPAYQRTQATTQEGTRGGPVAAASSLVTPSREPQAGGPGTPPRGPRAGLLPAARGFSSVPGGAAAGSRAAMPSRSANEHSDDDEFADIGSEEEGEEGEEGRVPSPSASDEEVERVLEAARLALTDKERTPSAPDLQLESASDGGGVASGGQGSSTWEEGEETSAQVSTSSSAALEYAGNSQPVLPGGLRQRRGGGSVSVSASRERLDESGSEKSARSEESEGSDGEQEEKGSGRRRVGVLGGGAWFLAAPGGVECEREKRKK